MAEAPWRQAGPPPPPGPVGNIPGGRLKSEIPARSVEPPLVVQNAMLTKDKKPFTYTPGGIDLSEIRSPRMARRLERNAMSEGVGPVPQQQPPYQTGPLPPSALAAMQPQLSVQVFPSGKVPQPGGGAPPPPPPPSGIPPPPKAPPMKAVSPVPLDVFERPDMTKIIPDNPMALLRKTSGPVIKRDPIFNKDNYSGGAQREDYAPPSPRPQVDYGPPRPQVDYGPPRPQVDYGPPSPRPQVDYGPPSPRPQVEYAPPTPRPQAEPPRQQPLRQPEVRAPDSPKSTSGVGSIYVPPLNQNNVPKQPQTPASNESSPVSYAPPPYYKRQPSTNSEPQSPQSPVQRQMSQREPQSPDSPKPALNKAPTPWLAQKRPQQETPEWVNTEEPKTQARAWQQAQQAPQVQPQPQQQQAPWRVQQQQQQPPPTPQSPPWQQKQQIQPEVQPWQHQPQSPAWPQQPQSSPWPQQPQSWQQQVQSPPVQPQGGVRKQMSLRERPQDSGPVERVEVVIVNDPPQVFQHPGPRGARAPPVQQNNVRVVPVQREGATNGHSPRVLQKITNTDGEDDEDSPVTEHGPRMTQNFPQRQISTEQVRRMKQESDQELMNKFKQVPQNQQNSRGPVVRTIPIQIEGDGPAKTYVPPSEQTVPEPKKYMGSAIPSRSFKILQAMTAPDDCGPVFPESKSSDDQLRLQRAAPFHHGWEHRPVTTTSFSAVPTEFSLPIEPDHLDEEEVVGGFLFHPLRTRARVRNVRQRGRMRARVHHRPLLRSPRMETEDEDDGVVGSPHMEAEVGMPNWINEDEVVGDFNGGIERFDHDVVGLPHWMRDEEVVGNANFHDLDNGEMERSGHDEDDVVGMPEINFDQRMANIPFWERVASPEEHHPIDQKENVVHPREHLERQVVPDETFEMQDLWSDDPVDPNFARFAFMDQHPILDQHFPEENQVGLLQMTQDANFHSPPHPMDPDESRPRAAANGQPEQNYNPWANLSVKQDEASEAVGLPYPDQEMPNFESSLPSRFDEPLTNFARYNQPAKPTIYYNQPEIVVHNIDNSEEVRQGLQPGFSIIPTSWKPPSESNLYVQGDYQSENGHEPLLAVLPGKWTRDYGYDNAYQDYQVTPVSYNIEDGYRRSAEDTEEEPEDGRRHFKKGSFSISKKIVINKPSKHTSLEIQHSSGHHKNFHSGGHQDSLHLHQQSQGFHQNSGPAFHQQQSQFHQGFHQDSSGLYEGNSGFNHGSSGSHQGSFGFHHGGSGLHQTNSHSQSIAHQGQFNHHQPNPLITINKQKTTVVVPHGNAQIAQVAGHNNALSQAQAGHAQHFQSAQVTGNSNSVSQSQARESDSVGAPFLINIPKRSSVWRSYHQERKRSVEFKDPSVELKKRSVGDEPTRINLFGDDPKIYNFLDEERETPRQSRKDDQNTKRATDGSATPLRINLFDRPFLGSKKRSVDHKPKIGFYGYLPSVVSIKDFWDKQGELLKEIKQVRTTKKRSVDDNVLESTNTDHFDYVNIPAVLAKQNEMLQAIKNVAQKNQDLILLTEIGSGMIDHFADLFGPHMVAKRTVSNNDFNSYETVKNISPNVVAKGTILEDFDNPLELCEMIEKTDFFRPSTKRIPVNRSSMDLTTKLDKNDHKIAKRSVFLKQHEIIKRTVPLIRLLADPNAELDMKKTLKNVGTAARSSLESKRQPIHHVRNFAGSAKDTLLSALKVVPQDFLIPSKYKIINKEYQAVDPNLQQSNVIYKKDPYQPSRRVYQPSSTRINQSPAKKKCMKKKYPQQVLKSADPQFADLLSKQPEFFDFGTDEPRSEDDTFRRVSSIFKDSFRSGQDVFSNIGDMYKSARKAVINIPHMAPRVALQSLRVPALKHPLRQRIVQKHRESSPSKGVVVVTPKVLHVEDAEKVGSPYPDNDFVSIEEVIDTLGLTNPEVEDLGHTRFVIRDFLPKKRAKLGRKRFNSGSSVDEENKHEKRKRYLLGSDEAPEEVKETLETIEALNNAKDSVGADTLKDFLSMMKSGFLDLLRDSMKIAEESLGDCLAYNKVKGKVLVEHQDEPPSVLGFSYEKNKGGRNKNIESGNHKKHHHHKHVKNEEQVGDHLPLSQQLLHPFMGRSSQRERQQFFHEFGDSVESEEVQNEDKTIQNGHQPRLFNSPLGRDGQMANLPPLLNLPEVQTQNIDLAVNEAVSHLLHLQQHQNESLSRLLHPPLDKEALKIQDENQWQYPSLPLNLSEGQTQSGGFPNIDLAQEVNKALSHLLHLQQNQSESLSRLLHPPLDEEASTIQNDNQWQFPGFPLVGESRNIQDEDSPPESSINGNEDLPNQTNQPGLIHLPLPQKALNVQNRSSSPLVEKNIQAEAPPRLINSSLVQENKMSENEDPIEQEVGAINPILFNDSYQLDFSKFPFLDVGHHRHQNISENATEGVKIIKHLIKNSNGDTTESTEKVGEALMTTSLWENNEDIATETTLMPSVQNNPNFVSPTEDGTTPFLPTQFISENSPVPANKQSIFPQKIIPNQQEAPVGLSMNMGKKLLTPYMGKADMVDYYDSYMEDSEEGLYLRNRKRNSDEEYQQYVGAQIEEIPEPKRINTVQQSFLRHPLEDNRL